MEIGITTYYIDNEFLIDLDKMESIGVHCLDYQNLISIDSPLYKLNKEEFKAYFIKLHKELIRRHMRVHQLHSMWNCPPQQYDNKDVLYSSTIEYYKKDILAAEYLHCKYVVIHHRLPDLDWDKDNDFAYTYNKGFLLTLLPYAEKHNITLCLENLPFTLKCTQFEDTLRCVKEINHPNLGMCLDTGHFNCFNNGYSFYDAFIAMGDYLKVLHIHDNDGYHDNHFFPYKGTIDWDQVSKGLKAINFQGVFSLETSSKNPDRDNCIKENIELIQMADKIANKNA